MSTEAVSFIEAGADLQTLAGLHGQTQEARGDFSAWMDSQLAELNEGINTADQLVRELATGESSNLHHVMLALEKTKLSFQLALQVRNRLLEGYQEIMRMQV